MREHKGVGAEKGRNTLSCEKRKRLGTDLSRSDTCSNADFALSLLSTRKGSNPCNTSLLSLNTY